MNQDSTPVAVSVGLEEIKAMIPHRDPMLLLDRVEEMIAGVSATGVKEITADEPYFAGHFPQRPIMPGVLIVESMAQAAAVLVVHTLGAEAEGKLVYFMSIDSARFRKPVEPGNTLKLHVEKLQGRRSVWKFKGEATVDGARVADATFAAMIAED